jgi:hypothetical protein
VYCYWLSVNDACFSAVHFIAHYATLHGHHMVLATPALDYDLPAKMIRAEDGMLLRVTSRMRVSRL